MESAADYWTHRAWLEMHFEAGVDVAIEETPVDRYALVSQAQATTEAPKKKETEPTSAQPAAAPKSDRPGPVEEAEILAQAATTRDALRASWAAFDGCDLKKGARNFVFCDGNPNARVMLVGEAPGREEDLQAKPFVGRAGQFLDRMFAAIALRRHEADPARALYVANVMPWRPPSNRTPDANEIAMMVPFLKRHIALIDPEVLVLLGNTPCQALLGRSGITRLRGQWQEMDGRPVLPMFHPAFLLRQPAQKREAWADLLNLKVRLHQP